MTTLQLTRLAVKVLEDKKAKDVQVLDVAGMSSLADYFVIASGSSFTQVRALTSEIDEKFSEQGHQPKRIERDTSSNWILLDYGDIIIHVFHHEAREFYNLEKIWGDAPRYDSEQFLKLGEKDV